MSGIFNFSSLSLLSEEKKLTLESLSINDALEIGEIAKSLGNMKSLPIAIEVRIGSWIIYHASLLGSTIENQDWINRKANVVLLKKHSTLFERVRAEEQGINWYIENNLSETLYAIHGGGLPLITKNYGFQGVLLISGLPHVQDHFFGVEVLNKFLNRDMEYDNYE
jgi:uncharacterized protein (UPF0303 family)